jgi:hypothetical protein
MTMETEDDLVLVEGHALQNGEWVSQDEWWPRSRLEALGKQVEMEQATFAWMVRRDARRRLYRIVGATVLVSCAIALVVKAAKRTE